MMLFISVSSCEDYLEVNPDFGISEDDVFSSYESIRGYLDNCYDVLYDIHSWRSNGVSRVSINALSGDAFTPSV